MKRFVFIAILAVILAGCAPSVDAPAPTETATPAMISPTVISTPTELFITFTPSPLPAEPTLLPMITPDTAQVERWREYETELAKVVLSIRPELASDPDIYKDAFCEWDILGESGQEVYVYVVCVIATGIADARSPAIIYLEPNGAIQKVKLPEPKANSSMFDYRPFPTDVQEKFCYYFDPFPSDLPPCPYSATYPRPKLDALYAHIKYRKTHPDEPPLVILMATSIPAPVP